MRRLARVCFSFGGAVLVSAYLTPGALPLALTAAVFAVLGAVFLFFPNLRKNGVWLILLGLAAGFGLSSFRLDYDVAPALELDGAKGSFTAEVTDYASRGANTAALTVRVTAPSGRSVMAQLYSYDDFAFELRPGDTVSFTATASLADKINGEETDYWFSRGAFLVLRGVKSLTLVSRPEKLPVRYAHLLLSHSLKESIISVFPEDAGPLALALVTGDKSRLAADAVRVLKDSGIYHLATVSGMHVSIISGFLMLLLRKRRWAPVIIMPLLVLFAGIAGFGPGVVRAVVMQGFVLSALLVMREADQLTSLSAALALLLALNPYAATGVGLQLSFASTLGSVLFSGKIFDFLSAAAKRLGLAEIRGFAAHVFSTAAASLSALAMTTPLSAVYFGFISVLGPVTNLLTAWAVTPALVLSSLAGTVGCFFPAAGRIVAFIASLFLRFVLLAARLLASSGAAVLRTDSPFVIAWLIFVYAGIVGFIALRPEKRKLALPISIAAVALCALVIAARSLGSSGYELTVLDVGQGQCVIVTSGSFVGIIDCGTTTRGRDAGKICRDWLEERRIDAVSMILLTHYHADHVNGVDTLLREFRVGTVIAPPPAFEDGEADEELRELAKSAGADIIYVTGDSLVSLGPTEITVFAPVGSEAENERGLTFIVADGGFETVITGDMGSSLEKLLVNKKALPDAECLIVGHHGSAGSTSEELLDKIAPEIGIISVAADNAYGHPAPEALARLRDSGVAVYRTDELGSITITTEGAITYG